jgi:hypothetical protein
VAHRVLELAAGLENDPRAAKLDQSLLDVGVDTTEHTRQEIATEQPCLGGSRDAVVVTHAQRDDGVKECVAGERTGRFRGGQEAPRR